MHTRLFIVQLLGILMLLCGYLLSDQPDSLSVMHFDPNPACPSVFTNSVKSTANGVAMQTCISSPDNSTHKTNVTRHISYEVILPVLSGFRPEVLANISYDHALPENYAFLFFEEINPPPPKAC
jgi:hypothetical protein